MKYYFINQPLKPSEPSGYKGLIIPLNLAESKLRALIARQKIEITNLDGVFDAGSEGLFKRGKLFGWKEKPVF